MFNRKHFTFFTLWFIVLIQTLFSQILLQGTVTDNGAEYLGNGAEAVANVLVTVIDQANSSRSFSSYTNDQGQYSIQITQSGVIDDPSLGADDFRLLQNYPNPFNPSTVIRYELSQPSNVTIQVYSVLGRKVKTLLDGFQNSSGQVVWDGADVDGKSVPAGVYIYSLEVNGIRMARKMTLVDGHHEQKSINPSNATASGTLSNNGLNKQAADLYLFRITGENIENYEQADMTITENLVLDVSVIRTVTDIDGNVYRTVKIGDQWWMAENLKVTHYRNNDDIPSVTSDDEWENSSVGAYCNFDNNPDNVNVYGRLYNWYAANDIRNIAPLGWHVPTDEEWKQLEMTLGMSRYYADQSNDLGERGTTEGGKMKTTGTIEAGSGLWLSPNRGATNESGFSGLPGGSRWYDGSYVAQGFNAIFWSSTEYDSGFAFHRYLHYDLTYISRNCLLHKKTGFSVRCVKGNNTPPTASFTVSPSNGTANTDFYFDASGCSDSEDAASTLQLRWDWDDDGTWDTDYSTAKTAMHRYTSIGTKTIWLEVKDSGGLTGMTTRQATVSDDSGGETVTDIDGNVYKTIKIGNQWWMAENLKVTRYRNGDQIPNIESGSEWSNLSTGAYCVFDNNESHAETYGYLYNWYAVDDSRNIAPAGWHVPTDEDWKQLEIYLGMSRSEADASGYRGTNEGSKLAGNASLWEDGDGDLEINSEFGTSGFSALPGGYRTSCGNYYLLGYYAYFWSSTEATSTYARYRNLYFLYSNVYRWGDTKQTGFSVRCLRD
jgi:uncharacterized protein (TIGR02145 family)